MRRVRAALEAYRQGVAGWLVASGGQLWHGVREAEAYRNQLLLGNVPAERVLMELQSLTTAGNAAHVAALFRARGWQRAALVTCDWHMPRARLRFERAGIECLPLPASSPVASLPVRGYRALRERMARLIERDLSVET